MGGFLQKSSKSSKVLRAKGMLVSLAQVSRSLQPGARSNTTHCSSSKLQKLQFLWPPLGCMSGNFVLDGFASLTRHDKLGAGVGSSYASVQYFCFACESLLSLKRAMPHKL